MFGINSWEFVIILLFVVIAFGPDKIPEIFKLLGKAAKMFREAKSQVEKVTSQVIRPEDLETLKTLKDPLGTQELKHNVATLLDPLKEATAPLRETHSSVADASSIWSSLSGPAASAKTTDSTQQPGSGVPVAAPVQPAVPVNAVGPTTSVTAGSGDAAAGKEKGEVDADPS